MDNFIDDIGLIRIGNGLIRIQTVRKMQTEGGEQRNQERGDLVMPISAFLSMHAGMSKAIDEMLQKGLLQRREDTEIEKTAQADAASDSDVVDTQVAKKKK